MAASARVLGARICTLLVKPSCGLNRCVRKSSPCLLQSPRLSNLFISRRQNAVPVVFSNRKFATLAASESNAWEERNLNDWAVSKLRELLLASEPIHFGEGSAYVTDVSRCTGDAAILTVRGKKRVDYSFDLHVDFQGKIEVGEPFEVEGVLSIDTCLGDLEDLRIDVHFTEVPETLPEPEREHLRSQMGQFLPKIRTQLECFEKEIKELVCDP